MIFINKKTFGKREQNCMVTKNAFHHSAKGKKISLQHKTQRRNQESTPAQEWTAIPAPNFSYLT